MIELVVEDGSGVSGANTYATIQEAVAFHAERGGLIPAAEIRSDEVSFQAGGVVLGTGLFAAVEQGSIVEVRGAELAGNSGYGHVRERTDDRLDLSWLEETSATEAAGEDVTILVYERSGFWHASPHRLAAALVSAANFMSKRYEWLGLPMAEEQALPWPRYDVQVYPGSPDYAAWYVLADDVVPAGVKRCQLWLALADLEAPLQAAIDPQKFLKEKSVQASGISKTFGGDVTRRRFPHADAEVAGLLSTASTASAGPYYPLTVV